MESRDSGDDDMDIFEQALVEVRAEYGFHDEGEDEDDPDYRIDEDDDDDDDDDDEDFHGEALISLIIARVDLNKYGLTHNHLDAEDGIVEVNITMEETDQNEEDEDGDDDDDNQATRTTIGRSSKLSPPSSLAYYPPCKVAYHPQNGVPSASWISHSPTAAPASSGSRPRQ